MIPETLYDIARRELGSPSEWRRIAAANGIRNVAPDSDSDLQTWLAKHHKTQIFIPAVNVQPTPPSASA